MTQELFRDPSSKYHQARGISHSAWVSRRSKWPSACEFVSHSSGVSALAPSHLTAGSIWR